MAETEEKRDSSEIERPEQEEKPAEDTGGGASDDRNPDTDGEDGGETGGGAGDGGALEGPDDKPDEKPDGDGGNGGPEMPDEPERPERPERPGDEGNDRPSGFPDTDLGLGIAETTEEYEQRRREERERERDREIDRERERRAREAAEGAKGEDDKTESKSPQSENSKENPIYEAIAPYYSEEGTEKFDIDRPTLADFVDWCCADNRFLGYNDKNDLKKNKDLGIEGAPKTDELANEVTGFVFGRLISTGLGAALISTGVLAWLGIIIMAYGNTPNSVMTSIKKFLTEKAFDMVPFDSIPNITEKMMEHAVGAKDRIKEKKDEVKKYADLAKSKSSVLRLGNLIRNYGRYLPYSKIKNAIIDLKDLQAKASTGDIKGPEVAQNFSQVFSKILQDFTKGRDQISQELQGVSEFLTKNNEGTPIFSNGFTTLIDSFSSLLTLKCAEDDITRDSTPKSESIKEKEANTESEAKQTEGETKEGERDAADDTVEENGVADEKDLTSRKNTADEKGATGRGDCMVGRGGAAGGDSAADVAEPSTNGVSTHNGSDSEGKDDSTEKPAASHGKEAGESAGPAVSTKSEADKDEKLDVAKSKMEATADSKEKKRPTSNMEKVRQMEKDRENVRSQ